MFQNTLEQKTKRVFSALAKAGVAQDFYLAGGTALALQFGHRQSIDLDFFTAKNFSLNQLKNKLNKLGKFKLRSEDEGTLHIILSGVLISFLRYPYPLLCKKIKLDNISLADWKDIACMKISAVSDRGSKKDFVDLYFILQKISLPSLLKLFNKKYKNIDYNKTHILKSLMFFEDADKEPTPKMLQKTSWPAIKKKIHDIVLAYTK